jgi:sialidase-1
MTVVSRGSRSGWAMSLRHGGRLSFCVVAAPGRLGCEQGGVVADAGLTGGWHHVAVARDGATMKLYVDAREAAVHQLAGALDGILPARSFPDAITRFGSSWDGSTPFVGLIDELAFFRRALNADDLARVMAATTVDGSKPRS